MQDTNPRDVRTANRVAVGAADRAFSVGFRCARGGKR